MDWEQKAREYTYENRKQYSQPEWSDVTVAYLAGVRDHTDWAQKELESD